MVTSDPRARLVEAAFEALVAEGPAFAVGSVAARAGVSKALLFHHFATREGLLDAMAAKVLAETREGLARLVLDHPNPRERWLALARALCEPAPSTTEAAHVLAFWMAPSAQGAPRGRARDGLVRDFLVETAREGVRTGAIRPGLDMDGLARDLLRRAHGTAALRALGAAPEDLDADNDRAVEELEGRLRRPGRV